MRERAAAPVVIVGSDRFTKKDLASLDCFNFLAAQNLNRILNDVLRVKNLREVYEKYPPTTFALPRMGAITLAVLGACFEAKGLGGDSPLMGWMERHKQKVQTFVHMKQRELFDEKQEKKARKKRKAARRDEAHAKRVERFEEKSQEVH
jgi:hypothetical protein